jgi:hypothetical protein
MRAKDVKSFAETFDAIDRLQAEHQWSPGRAAVERLQWNADLREWLRPGWQKLLIFLLWATFVLGLATVLIEVGVYFVLASRLAGG